MGGCLFVRDRVKHFVVVFDSSDWCSEGLPVSIYAAGTDHLVYALISSLLQVERITRNLYYPHDDGLTMLVWFLQETSIAPRL